MTDKGIKNLQQVLDRIESASVEHGDVSLGAMMEEIGYRSFGPLLVLAGVIIALPIVGDIPGVPTMVAVIVAVIATQLLAGRNYFWLPGFLLRRSVSREKLQKSVAWARKPARFIDKGLKPRLTFLVKGMPALVIAGIALFIAAITPVTEIIPFSANIAGAALLAYGLSLIAEDGLLAIVASVLTTAIVILLGYSLFSG
ncbi:exopolysaccharide biosynthesis protein [Halopseudomonas salegens]|nr:exopolysaccharide biosynthesis protein [Halopseudomonas salegens]